MGCRVQWNRSAPYAGTAPMSASTAKMIQPITGIGSSAERRRQIVDFLLPGDLFGFHTGDCSVECVVANTMVVRYPRREMESLMEANPQLARGVREFAFESIDRMQSRIILLGRSRAMERVCEFLLEMAYRVQIESLETVSLPMSRYDIADYLAI